MAGIEQDSGAGHQWPLADTRGMGCVVSLLAAWWILVIVVTAGAPADSAEHWGYLRGLLVRNLPILFWTGVALLALRATWRVLEVDAAGMRLRYRGRVWWERCWDNVRSWQAEKDWRGRLIALRLADREGREERLRLQA